MLIIEQQSCPSMQSSARWVYEVQRQLIWRRNRVWAHHSYMKFQPMSCVSDDIVFAGKNRTSEHNNLIDVNCWIIWLIYFAETDSGLIGVKTRVRVASSTTWRRLALTASFEASYISRRVALGFRWASWTPKAYISLPETPQGWAWFIGSWVCVDPPWIKAEI